MASDEEGGQELGMEWQEGSDGYDMVRRKGGKSGEVVGKGENWKQKCLLLSLLSHS